MTTSQIKVKYRIRDMVTGLYQKSGHLKRGFHSEAVWSDKGKTWKDIIELKRHLSALQEQHVTISPLWQIVELGPKNVERDCYPASALT